MTGSERSADLAVGWIEAWARMDMVWLRERVAPDFVPVSPFGRLEGRESYLETVEPMARKSVSDRRSGIPGADVASTTGRWSWTSSSPS